MRGMQQLVAAPPAPLRPARAEKNTPQRRTAHPAWPLCPLGALVHGRCALSVPLSISSRCHPPGPRRARPEEWTTDEAFECGNPATGTAWARFSVKFYMIAILFIVFDLEVVFLYPWAIVFRELGLFGFIEMMGFIAVLTVGLVFAWRKGALEWN